MKRSPLCAIVLLALLVGLIVVPPAAAEPRSGPALSGLASVLERLWSFVSIFQAKNGCILDPDGALRCGPAPAATTKNGCILDPSGVPRCEPAAATPTTDNGCQIDPNGACRE
jgi:hypothetical protein